jgi:hypothetical protein
LQFGWSVALTDQLPPLVVGDNPLEVTQTAKSALHNLIGGVLPIGARPDQPLNFQLDTRIIR